MVRLSPLHTQSGRLLMTITSGLNTHGLFDDADESDEYVERDLERDSEKDSEKGHAKDKSISCVTEISVSSHGRRRADENV